MNTTPGATELAEGRQRPWGKVAIWAVFAVPLTLMVLFASVTGRLDEGLTDRRPIRDFWQVMHRSLPEVGPDWLLGIAYWFGILLFLAGSLALLWITLGLQMADSPPPDEDFGAAGVPAPPDPELPSDQLT